MYKIDALVMMSIVSVVALREPAAGKWLITSSPRPPSKSAIILRAGQTVDLAEQLLRSQNSTVALSLDSEGDLVIIKLCDKTVIWKQEIAEHSDGQNGTMERNGNFILYGSTGNVYWQTKTAGNPGADLRLDDDGFLCVYHNGRCLWTNGQRFVTSCQPNVLKAPSTKVLPKAELLSVPQMLPISTTRTRPTPRRSLTLPLFRMEPVSATECLTLNTKDCVLGSYSKNCTSNIFIIQCSSNASNSEVTLMLEKINRLNKDWPIEIQIRGQRTIEPGMFEPTKHNILFLVVSDHDNMTTRSLANIDLPNLIYLRIHASVHVEIFSDDLDSFPQLRTIRFSKTSFKKIENGAFDKLLGLKTLAVEFESLPPYTQDDREHFWQLHCSCEYSWLRELFHRRPSLLKKREFGEVFNFLHFGNKRYNQTFVPVDCAKSDLIGSVDQTTFAINDDC